MSIVEALERVRSELAQAGRSVRLVGLSGTGKTRFAEALFDDSVGTEALPRSRVIYGDVASAQVSPVNVAEQLIAGGRPAIMIADNCPAATHRHVANIIGRTDSHVSFLSIDYDVGEDQPESTVVARLERDSDELIRSLLEQRAPRLQFTDRERIVEFSGGNSRIALVLVRSALEAGSIANLTDRDLVRRLFQDDRHPTSDTLMRCAEVASLVISYSVDPSEAGTGPEYHHLARLAGVSCTEMFRAIGEFLDRGVGQQRGPWRAILPHALAARLARQALERIPRAQLYEAFATDAPRRLALSFAKRLGQVCDHSEAQALARMFLAQNGPVGVVSADDAWSLEMLQALAPAAEELALDVIARSLDSKEGESLIADTSIKRYHVARLLMQLAYKKTRFARAAWLLAWVVKTEQRGSTGYQVLDLFTQLFWAVMPGTLAPPDQLLDFVDDLLASGDPNVKFLAVDALDAALKTAHFSSRADIAMFGGQARSLGWERKSREQIERQFARAASVLTSMAVSDDPLADRARSVLAHRLRELGANGFIHIVEEAAQAVRARGFWAAGWGEICSTLRFSAESVDDRLRERLAGLERLLAPRTLDERFEAFVLHPYWDFYIPVPEHEEHVHVDVRAQIESIATELKDGGGPLTEYVRRATCPAKGDAALFGWSLVTAGFGVDDLFMLGVEDWEAADPKSRQSGFLFGVLGGATVQDAEAAEDFLDRIAGHESLACELVSLSCAVRPLSPRSMERILGSLRAGHLQPNSLERLAGAAARNELPQAELSILLAELEEHEKEGNKAAAFILCQLLSGEGPELAQLSPDIWAVANRVVESEHLFSSKDILRTHAAKVVVQAVLEHENDPRLASTVVRNIRLAMEGGA